MGERLLCKQEVAGSIPVSSTKIHEWSGSGKGSENRTHFVTDIGAWPSSPDRLLSVSILDIVNR